MKSKNALFSTCGFAGFFLLVLVLLQSSFSIFAEEAPKWQKDLTVLEQKIHCLEETKKRFEADAIYHENEGERLQFVNGQLSLAKKHWQAASGYWKAAEDVQVQIDLIEKEKRDLMNKNRKANY